MLVTSFEFLPNLSAVFMCLCEDIYVFSSQMSGWIFLLCMWVMVDFLLWFPAHSRDYSWSVGPAIVLLIHGRDTQLIIPIYGVLYASGRRTELKQIRLP